MTHTRKSTVLCIALILFASAVSAYAGVSVSSPTNGATVTSPVHVAATATSSYTITAMRIYLDNVSMYTVNANSLSYNLTAAAGTHNLVVQAWDSTGAVFKNSETIYVSGATSTTTTTTTTTTGICGKPTDGLVHAVPDYTSFVPPGLGGTYNDQMYGCPVKRLSVPSLFNVAVHHYYSSVVAVNSDDSLVIMRRDSGGFYVANLSDGRVYWDPKLSLSSEPSWSKTDPHVIYYHSGNSLMKYDLLAHVASTVHQFTQFSSITFGGQNGAGGEGDISEDGNHIVIAGNGYIVGVYTFSTNTLGPTYNAGSSANFDWWDMTPSNNVVVRWLNTSVRPVGIYLFNSNMQLVRQVTNFGSHSDRGRDLDGSDIIVMSSDPDTSSACGGTSGVEKIRLSDSKKTCLLKLGWWGGVTHVSVSSKAGYVVADVADSSSTTHLYSNEFVLLKLDGTLVQRLAQSRSRQGNYWAQPRASLSNDGQYLVFDSNMAGSSLSNYTDVYVIKVK